MYWTIVYTNVFPVQASLFFCCIEQTNPKKHRTEIILFCACCFSSDTVIHPFFGLAVSKANSLKTFFGWFGGLFLLHLCQAIVVSSVAFFLFSVLQRCFAGLLLLLRLSLLFEAGFLSSTHLFALLIILEMSVLIQ